MDGNKKSHQLRVGFESAVALLKGQQQHVRLEAEQQHAEIVEIRINSIIPAMNHTSKAEKGDHLCSAQYPNYWMTTRLKSLLRPMRFDMVLRRMFGVLNSMNMVRMRQVCMMSCFLVIARFVMIRGFMVMARCMLMMFCRLPVMMSCFL
jgi:hypothetical protein